MKRAFILLSTALLLVGFTVCTPQSEDKTLSGLDVNNFTRTINEKQGKLFVLKNKNGMEVCITNLGARIVSVMVPDKAGKMKDVVLGFDSIIPYINVKQDFGATIGRYANRIANGKITIDGDSIQLPLNNFGHCLHGGPNGWQYKIFEGSQVGNTATFSLISPDGDENFPGNVRATVSFTLTDENAIDINYSATTDKKTVINMTNHSYFNLSGDPTTEAIDHILYVDANTFTPVDSTFMTTGEVLSVKGTPMDFTSPKVISKDIDDQNFIQVVYGKGYDHNWILNSKGDINGVCATLASPKSGIILEVYTTEPGIQVYTGNFLDGTITGKKGVVYNKRAAVCLETQHYPDSPNKPEWPSTILEPGNEYKSRTVYKFSIAK